MTTITGRMTCKSCGSPSFHLSTCPNSPGKNRTPAMPENHRTPSEKAADRVEELTDEQRSRLLFRLCARVPDAVSTAIDDFERTAWRWGE